MVSAQRTLNAPRRRLIPNVLHTDGVRPTTPTVSSVDWAIRWEKAIKCLAVEEPDNQDMFEIDELAVKAFWDRVWACYLPYVLGSEDA